MMGGNGSKHILRSCKLHDSERFSPGVDRSGFSAQLCHFLVICPTGIAQLFPIEVMIHWVAMNLIIPTKRSVQCGTTHEHSVKAAVCLPYARHTGRCFTCSVLSHLHHNLCGRLMLLPFMAEKLDSQRENV